MEIHDRIRRFIVENFYVADGAALGPDTSLLEHGIVDSTGVLEVIAFLESEFGIAIADHELVPGNLDSIGRMAAFVETKRAAA